MTTNKISITTITLAVTLVKLHDKGWHDNIVTELKEGFRDAILRDHKAKCGCDEQLIALARGIRADYGHLVESY
jgi:hypothetical protein